MLGKKTFFVTSVAAFVLGGSLIAYGIHDNANLVSVRWTLPYSGTLLVDARNPKGLFGGTQFDPAFGSGKVPFNGKVDVTFELYEKENSANPVWSETQTVIVANGSLSTVLGADLGCSAAGCKPSGAPISAVCRTGATDCRRPTSGFVTTPVNPLPATAFKKETWIGMYVGKDASNPQTMTKLKGRQRLGGSLYALRASVADAALAALQADYAQTADLAHGKADRWKMRLFSDDTGSPSDRFNVQANFAASEVVVSAFRENISDAGVPTGDSAFSGVSVALARTTDSVVNGPCILADNTSCSGTYGRDGGVFYYRQKREDPLYQRVCCR